MLQSKINIKLIIINQGKCEFLGKHLTPIKKEEFV